MVIDRYTGVNYLVALGVTERRIVHFDMLKPYGGNRRPIWLRHLQREIDQQREPTTTQVPEAPQSAVAEKEITEKVPNEGTSPNNSNLIFNSTRRETPSQDSSESEESE